MTRALIAVFLTAALLLPRPAPRGSASHAAGAPPGLGAAAPGASAGPRVRELRLQAQREALARGSADYAFEFDAAP